MPQNKSDEEIVESDPNPNLDDARRKTHRLETARRTIYVGLGLIGLFCLASFISSFFDYGSKEANYEVLRDGVVAASTIITLALGFIAGSNID